MLTKVYHISHRPDWVFTLL